MRKVKQLSSLFLALFLLGIAGCKKEGPAGPQGPQGPAGPQAKSYAFSLTFGTSVTEATYTVPESIFNKTVLVYLDQSYREYILLPYLDYSPGYVPVNYSAVVDDVLDMVTVRTNRGDNQAGSPWATAITIDFKLVIIETTAMNAVADVIDVTNYSQVAKWFNIE